MVPIQEVVQTPYGEVAVNPEQTGNAELAIAVPVFDNETPMAVTSPSRITTLGNQLLKKLKQDWKNYKEVIATDLILDKKNRNISFNVDNAVETNMFNLIDYENESEFANADHYRYETYLGYLQDSLADMKSFIFENNFVMPELVERITDFREMIEMMKLDERMPEGQRFTG